MTTPAVNVNVTQVRSEKIGTVPISPAAPGPEVITTTNLVRYWKTETRPVSGNADRVGGFLKCRPFNHLKQEWTQKGPNCSYDEHTGTSSASKTTYYGGSIWGASRPPGAAFASSNMINAATNKALQQLKSPDIHLGNFFAEIKKTQELYVSLCNRIAVEVRAFRFGKPKLWLLAQRYEGSRDRGLWCLIPREWLVIQYGWKPHMSDLFGAVNHLARRGRFKLPYTVVKGSVQDTIMTNTSVTSPYWGLRGTTTFRTIRKAQVQLVYAINSPILAELSSLGLINPAEIVWEQLRYSFVVDWVLPIGQWLSNLTADVGYNFVTGSLSKYSETQFVSSSLDSRTPDNSTSHWLGGGPPTYVGKSINFERTCYLSSPVPGLYVKNPLSPGHIANASALLVQAFFSRSR
jgi:hypothetical protein